MLLELVLSNGCTHASTLWKALGSGSSAVERQVAKAWTGVDDAEVLMGYRTSL